MIRPSAALLALSLVLAGLPTSATAQAAPAPEAEVEKVVRELFDHMRAGDAQAMSSLMHESVRLVTTSERDGVPVAQVVPVSAWLESVAEADAELDERLYHLDVRVAGGLATVWTGYELLVDGRFSHCGVDAFQLVDTAHGWQILQVTDTRQTEGCPGR